MIKFGKTLSAIKNDSFLSVGQRFLKGMLLMIKYPSRGDIIYITGGAGQGASSHYRCFNQAEELNNNGLTSEVIIQDSPWLMSCVDRFNVFIFHRTVLNRRLEKFINKIKKQNKKIIFETDDLLFDEKYLAQSGYMDQANVLEKKQFEKGLGAELLADSYIETYVASTEFLADKLRRMGKKVFVSKNKLSSEEVEWANNLMLNKKADDGSVVIGYFSGSKGHDKDFETVSNPILRIMEKYSRARLLLAGPLEISAEFSKFQKRITRLSFVSRKKHFKNLSKIDINIAPLEENDFCAAKSELKFFEAGILTVPTVAFGNATFQGAIEDGADGFIANDDDQWFEKLDRLIADEKLRRAMGEKARQKTLDKYTTKSRANPDYYEYLRLLIKL